MTVKVNFFSYFKDLTGCGETTQTLPDAGTVAELHEQLIARFPKLGRMRKSTLIAVGVDYQPRDHVLKEGDDVSLFPPVQGG